MRFNPLAQTEDRGQRTEVRGQRAKTKPAKRRSKLPPQTAQEALDRVLTQKSTMNYATIFEGFLAKGIPMADIEPRVNVFTYDAWRAKGRQVRQGEHGVKVVTWITRGDKETINESGERVVSLGRRFPRTSRVFHISETEEANETACRSDGVSASVPEPALVPSPAPRYTDTPIPSVILTPWQLRRLGRAPSLS